MTDRARVMIVGRTPLDAELRRDPRFEVLRPRGATEAIGELAEASESGESRRTLVLVAKDAVGPDRSSAFAGALRRIVAQAKVYEVSAGPPTLAGLDGVIAPSAGAAGVASLLLPRETRPPGTPPAEPALPAHPHPHAQAKPITSTTNPEVSQAPAPVIQPVMSQVISTRPTHATAPDRTRPGVDASRPVSRPAGDLFPDVPTEHASGTPSAPPAGPSRADWGADRGAERTADRAPSAPARPNNVHEHTPLGALLAGRDAVQAALATITALRGRAVRYVTSAQAEAGDRAVHDMTPVTYAGRTFGYLGVDGSGPAPAWLAQDAGWLAGWAALLAQHEQLRHDAFRDELTGAYNRRYFQRFLGAAIEHSRQARRPVSLLVFDIDNFKSFNDRYGHAAGDDILVETVRLLKTIVRPSDRVCRVGGDEFAVIFHDPDGPRNPGSPESVQGLQSVADIARRFQKQLCEHRFPKLSDEAPGTCSISGGMATFPWDGQTPQQLLEQADALALRSKRQGKNAITLGPGAEHACGGGAC